MAVRAIDWKYANGAELTDTGFHATVLSRFRARLAEHGMERAVFDRLLEVCRDQGLIGAGGRQRTDSTHVISAVRDLNRTELAGESVRAALEALAAAAAGWLAGPWPMPGPSRPRRPGRPSTHSAPESRAPSTRPSSHRPPTGPLPQPAQGPPPTRLLRHRRQRHPPRRPLEPRPTTLHAPDQQTHPPQPPTHNPNPKGVAPALGPRNTRLQLRLARP
ncbi:transposase [Streptomyces sp. NPDC001226]